MIVMERRGFIRHHILGAISETANVTDLEQVPPYTTLSVLVLVLCCVGLYSVMFIVAAQSSLLPLAARNLFFAYRLP